MPDLDWSDLKHALAVADAGSLAGASRQLGVNHTTVLRRLDALEANLGTRLFDRKRSGYEPTEAGQAVLVRALGVGEVVVATGAQRNAPAIPGADQDHVWSGDELRRLTHHGCGALAGVSRPSLPVPEPDR